MLNSTEKQQENSTNNQRNTDMHPDNQIIQDLKYGFLIALITIPLFWIVVTFGGYPPADECANTIKNGTSYTRQKMLIDDEPNYNNVRAWCVHNLESWEDQLNQARGYQTADYQY